MPHWHTPEVSPSTSTTTNDHRRAAVPIHSPQRHLESVPNQHRRLMKVQNAASCHRKDRHVLPGSPCGGHAGAEREDVPSNIQRLQNTQVHTYSPIATEPDRRVARRSTQPQQPGSSPIALFSPLANGPFRITTFLLQKDMHHGPWRAEYVSTLSLSNLPHRLQEWPKGNRSDRQDGAVFPSD